MIRLRYVTLRYDITRNYVTLRYVTVKSADYDRNAQLCLIHSRTSTGLSRCGRRSRAEARAAESSDLTHGVQGLAACTRADAQGGRGPRQRRRGERGHELGSFRLLTLVPVNARCAAT